MIKKAKEQAGFDPNISFHIPQASKIRFESAVELGDLEEAKWKDKLEKVVKKNF